ncbi:unnamed protein product (macronuclear) [Paramecium tetraurelia]|uniref:Uncharacterized protein n=1 Tax=Paramecium tetraurelia TaxID=5888 RepID=A0D5G4_PARTE|nr:uncharacterized protein GSPATT00013730001 [Paramecium tetraurelia]CAK78281.1 unnamed protein product [Paramecium tetraurelia]|eukprot:XP_001445678.1 hypothetical protein (macronuclear) [Paramecium tetraurelia strain d4-2]
MKYNSNYQFLVNLLCIKNVKYRIIKAKLDGHTSASVNFSSDGTTIAFSGDDNSIRLWNVKTSKEILLSGSCEKDILTQFKIPLQNSSLLSHVYPYCTILRMCQNPLQEASAALILQGQSINNYEKDLKPLFKSKGSCILEDIKQKLRTLQLQSQSISFSPLNNMSLLSQLLIFISYDRQLHVFQKYPFQANDYTILSLILLNYIVSLVCRVYLLICLKKHLSIILYSGSPFQELMYYFQMSSSNQFKLKNINIHYEIKKLSIIIIDIFIYNKAYNKENFWSLY